MRNLFLTVLNMSLTASFVILIVLAVRFLLRKTPKKFSYALWAVVLFRLLCPVALESAVSLVPSARPLTLVERPDETERSSRIPDRSNQNQAVPVQTAPAPPEQIVPAQTVSNSVPPSVLTAPDNVQAFAPKSSKPDAVAIAAAIWLAGVGGMALYSGISLLRLRRRLVGASPDEEGVWLADHIATPFVLGLIRPRIYLPSTLDAAEREYILLHERTHIRRKDYVVKALAFAALAVHWFNPLAWLAFHLAGKDMEMSCDEAVLKRLGRDVRADYSSSLLRLSAGRRLPVGPLAFGDGDPQSRIRNVMNYKKPAAWVMAVALLAVLAACTALSTNPAGQPDASREPGASGQFIDLSELSAELEFSVKEENRSIRIWGDVGGESMGTDAYPGDRIHWYPTGADYPLGYVHIGYAPFDCGIRGSVTAAWTDESHTAVTLSTFSMAVASSWSNTHWWEFTVELSGTGGTVTERKDCGPVVTPGNEQAHYLPESISEEEAVKLAQIAAKLLTGAENYYNSQGLDWLSSSESAAQWDKVLAPYAAFGLTWEFDDPDGDGNGLTMWFDGKVVKGIVDDETWIAEHIGNNFPEGAIELFAVYTDGKLTGLRAATAEEQAEMDQMREQNENTTSVLPTLSFTEDGTPYAGHWDYGFTVNGLNAGSVTWYPPGKWSGELGKDWEGFVMDWGLLKLENPAFLGGYFTDAKVYGTALWMNENHPAIHVDLFRHGDDEFKISWETSLADGAVRFKTLKAVPEDEAALLMDETLSAAGLTLANIMTAAEGHWYDNEVCGYPLAPSDTPQSVSWFSMPLEMEFSSGAGGWRTSLILNPDGTFKGDYSDSDMGVSGDGYQSTQYVCQFHGRFGDVEQVTDASWSLTLKELVIDTGHPVGEEWIEKVDGYNIRFVSSDPAGFDSADEGPLEPGAKFMLYAPAAKGYAPGDELYGMTGDNTDYDSTMYGFWTWWPDKREWTPNSTLGSWGLCSMQTGKGFFTFYSTGEQPLAIPDSGTFSWEEERAEHTGQPGVKESGFVHSSATGRVPNPVDAAEELMLSYNRVKWYQDPDTGMYKFEFWNEYPTPGDGQTVYMDGRGVTKMIVSGE